MINYIGMDIHKKFTVAVAKDRDGNKLAEEKFDNSKSNFKVFLKIFNPEERKNKFQVIVSPEKKDENLWLNQDAYLSLTDLEKNKSLNYKIHTKGNGIYLFLIEGEISVGNEVLSMRDGIGIWEIDEFSITAHSNSKILLIEIPMM